MVHVGFATGAILPYRAEVRLYDHMGFLQHTARIGDDQKLVINDVPMGEYAVELVAEGYPVTRAEAVLWRGSMVTHVFLNLRPALTVETEQKAPGFLVLAPKARKETEKGLAALRANKLKEAQARLEQALKLAPGHPLVNYLMGLLYLRLNDLARARTHMEKAAAFAPDNPNAHAALGMILYHQGDYPGAIRALERALVLKPDSWDVHLRIARAYYHAGQYDKARAHAERAKELAKGKAPETQLLLAYVLAVLGQRERAAKELESFLSQYPNHEGSPVARRLLERLRREPAAALTTSASNVVTVAPELPVSLPLEAELPARQWAPPQVDEAVPRVAPDVTCSLPQVLRATGQRAVALVENLQRFTATESVEVAELDAAGNASHSQTRTFEYLVSIREIRPGMLSVEENREKKSSLGSFPERLAATGLTALALVFHPYYVGDFEIHCEGLGQWRGEPAWQIYFRERPEVPSRIHIYKTRNGRFPAKLKGRAWIAANGYQILRLETEAAEPIKEIDLEREHLVIEYGPVDFVKRKVRLWLPSSADLYALFRGHRYHHRHSFSDFMLFSVDVAQRIKEPSQP